MPVSHQYQMLAPTASTVCQYCARCKFLIGVLGRSEKFLSIDFGFFPIEFAINARIEKILRDDTDWIPNGPTD